MPLKTEIIGGTAEEPIRFLRIVSGVRLERTDLTIQIPEAQLALIWRLREEFQLIDYSMRVLHSALQVYEKAQAPNYENAAANVKHIVNEFGKLFTECKKIIIQIDPFISPRPNGYVNLMQPDEWHDFLVAFFSFVSLTPEEKKT